MDFELSQDHKVLQAAVRDFVEKEIKPIAIKIDEEHSIPDGLLKKMGEMGFLGSYLSEQYSGAGLDMLSYVILVEEVSKASGSCGVLISAHTSAATAPIYAFGTERAEKEMVARPQSRRGHRLLFVDRAERRQRRRRNRHHVQAGRRRVCHQRQQDLHHQRRISGHRNCLCLPRPLAETQGHRALIVDLKSPGVTVLKNENKMGVRGTYTTAFALDNVRVPAKNLLGEEGKGFHVAMDALNGGRIGIASQALGITEGAFERALAYAKEREAVRSAHQRVSGDSIQAGRHVRPDRDQQTDDL